MTLALHYALRSDVGLLREGNEDSAYAGPNLLAIADGMGGHAAGEVASAVAISALAPLDHQGLHDSEDMLGALADAVAAANSTLHEMSIADPSVEGMGTTLTALLWSGAQVALCHIGDSRAYLLRDGEFYQITRDHTLVQSLVDEGRLSPEAAATHPQRSLVMRALQSSTDAEPDLGMREGRLGDRYLLCSDGLSDVVTEQTMHKTLITCTDADQAVLQLIDLAIRSGGPDNITCIVADVVDTETGPVPPSQDTVLVGAAANGDGRPRPRSDSPASRAHQLTQSAPQLARPPAPAPGPARPPDDYHSAGYHSAGNHSDDDFDGDADTETGRRRWPVVTSILVILIVLIAGGAFTAWHITQGQYYVSGDGQQVIIYRGVNEKVAGLTLSSAFLHTGIPISHVDGSVLVLPTPAGSLTEAQHTVQNIRRTYQCKQADLAVTKWEAGKPKPPPPAVKGHKLTKQQIKANKLAEAKVKAYPPKPAVPSFCPAQGAG
jgi:serine/threonine protein phosphatase PrpC